VDDAELEITSEVIASCRGGVHADGGGQAGAVPPDGEGANELEMRRIQTMLDTQQVFLGGFLGNYQLPHKGARLLLCSNVYDCLLHVNCCSVLELVVHSC
jgi:hypothetical protein